MEFLAASIIIASVVFGVATFLGKPLSIVLTLKTESQEPIQIPMTKEEEHERSIQLGVAAAIQEAMGVFHDDDK